MLTLHRIIRLLIVAVITNVFEIFSYLRIFYVQCTPVRIPFAVTKQNYIIYSFDFFQFI
jgi:hypothetical protein